MFDSTDIRALRATLDCIPVAMFAAGRPTPADAFRVHCINRQHEDESGLANIDVSGLRPMEFLPAEEGEAVESRYAFSARHGKMIGYSEVLHLNGRETRWHTVLYPVAMPKQEQRIIGCTFALAPDGRFPAAMPVIEAAMDHLRGAAAHRHLTDVAARPNSAPEYRPAAKVIDLTSRIPAQAEGFREPGAVYLGQRRRAG